MAVRGSFTPIQQLSPSGGVVNVIGVVVDHLPSCPTRGTDWQCTFNLTDEGSTYEGQRVKMFLKDPARIPPIRGTGDVVILRNIQLRKYQGSNILLSGFNTQWTVFHCSEIPVEKPASEEPAVPYVVLKGAPEPSTNDMLQVIDLCNLRSRCEWTSKAPVANDAAGLGPTTPAPAPLAALRDKFSLIEGIGANQFFDLVGQVVKMFPVGDRLDLSITDYTENSLLFNYNPDNVEEDTGRDGDPFGYITNTHKRREWNAPNGKYTLTVTLFWPHSSFATSKIREGHYVFLRNVHIKLGRDGSSRLEGALHTDKKFPERVDILRLGPETDERVKDLLKRKKHFQKNMTSGTPGRLTSVGLQLPQEENRSKDLSKSQLKRQRRKQREADQKERENDANPNAGKKAKIEKDSTIASKYRALLELNQHMACTHPDQPCRTVASINRLDQTHVYSTPEQKKIILPFQNLKFRTKVRVVDFAPSNLEDFAVRSSEYEILEDDEGDGDNSDDTSPLSSSPPSSGQSGSLPPDSDAEIDPQKRWTWFFTLYVEDASDLADKTEADRMAIHVADEDAVFLLNLDAANLRRKDRALAELREKLFILWGDLEERKRAGTEVSTQRSPTRAVLKECDGNARRGETSSRNNIGSGESPPCKPFICCVKEYGIKQKGQWQRRFRMFGTSIR